MLKICVFSFRLRGIFLVLSFRFFKYFFCGLSFRLRVIFWVFSLTLSGVFLRAQFQIERVKRHHGRLDQLFLEESNRRHLRRMLNAEDRTPLVQELRLLLQQAYGDRSEGLAKELGNKGVNACCCQTGQKHLQRS